MKPRYESILTISAFIIVYAGVMEALSGLPVEVSFLSFAELLASEDALKGIDVVISVGGPHSAHSGGPHWEDFRTAVALRRFVATGGGFIGVGEPSSHQRQGHFFQLSQLMGVVKEMGCTLGCDKYNWDVQPHFITEETGTIPVDFGQGNKNIYALPGAQVLAEYGNGVQLVANKFVGGRSVYASGLPYNFTNTRLLYRAILWACGAEEELHRWFASNPCVEVNAYEGRFCIANNSPEAQKTNVWRGDESSFEVELEGGQIPWYT